MNAPMSDEKWWGGRRAILLLQAWVMGHAPANVTLTDAQHAAQTVLEEYDHAKAERDYVVKYWRESAENWAYNYRAERDRAKSLRAQVDWLVEQSPKGESVFRYPDDGDVQSEWGPSDDFEAVKQEWRDAAIAAAREAK